VFLLYLHKWPYKQTKPGAKLWEVRALYKQVPQCAATAAAAWPAGPCLGVPYLVFRPDWSTMTTRISVWALKVPTPEPEPPPFPTPVPDPEPEPDPVPSPTPAPEPEPVP
jgi:outer membrane biosynthesis protein TonB